MVRGYYNRYNRGKRYSRFNRYKRYKKSYGYKKSYSPALRRLKNSIKLKQMQVSKNVRKLVELEMKKANIA